MARGWGQREAALATLVALAAGCAARSARPPAAPAVVRVDPAQAPVLVDDLDLASLRTAIERTRPTWAKRGDTATSAAATRLLEALAATDPAARGRAVTGIFAMSQLQEPVLLTSYYEPELRAQPRRGGVFQYPIYGRPRDLVDGGPPYATRAQIEAGALDGQGLVLAWTDDPIKLFFLHVQGSGRLRMKTGVVPVQYAGTNGQPYRALGSVLIERGLLTREEATMPGIVRVLSKMSRQEQLALMAENPRFTFFRRGKRGAVGSLGVELTPGRSVATDPAVVPPGSIGYLVTPTVRRFVVSQDAGAAIKGARVDLFAGAGEAAEGFAGSMRDPGTFYILVPR